jgi:hypothetical protein
MKFDYNEIANSWTSKDLLEKMSKEERLSLPAWTIKKMQLREIDENLKKSKRDLESKNINLVLSMLLSIFIFDWIGFYTMLLPLPFLVICILKYISNKKIEKNYKQIKDVLDIISIN